jgi:hypothetical protein
VQRLPNVNTLIDQGIDARFFQVTRAGEIVWSMSRPMQVLRRSCRCSCAGKVHFWRGALRFCALRGTRQGFSSGRLQTGCIGHRVVSSLQEKTMSERSTPEPSDGPSIDDEAAANLAFADEGFA